MKCKNCGHELILWQDPKNPDNKKWLHYNRFYFGTLAINDKWCSMCETLTKDKRTFAMKEVCNNPEPERDDFMGSYYMEVGRLVKKNERESSFGDSRLDKS